MLKNCKNCIYEFTEFCDPDNCLGPDFVIIEFEEYDYFGRTEHLYN